ncbi:Taurine hydroxylase-like protein SAT17 [Lachnellula suecica]|uniref:Taurine hydroxylase-like protein SAT17 n=1 Tax=Lachnellula suecica TaxID=602035 RepID=A0A8T9C5P8_9HELO|nr:Taurine hydroxylase-like protein SAT17 [Lachnellula suecica]
MALTQRQPDISYHPDFEKYQLRTERLKRLRPATPVLPAGFPAQLTGGLVWEGKDFTDEKQWTFSLDESHLAEIHRALGNFKSLNKPIGYVSQSTFPLPELSPILRQQALALQAGRGFFVLRGLQPDKYTREENIIIYAGVSSYIGSVRGRQDNKVVDGVKQSSMLNHIKDLSQTSVAKNIGAPAYTTDKQVFHTDAGDIVSLFSLNTAAQGGESKLASSWRVYNELAKTRPDVIKTLAGDWVFDGYGNAEKPYSVKPLLHHTAAHGNTPERVIIQYARRGFTGFLHLPRSESIPPITEAQAEALDALHFLADKFSLTLDFQKGDVQYVNNLSIFHARDGFVDAPGQERHLLRLWLRDPELAWETPAVLQPRWDELYKDVTEDEQVFPLEPKIRGGAGKA